MSLKASRTYEEQIANLLSRLEVVAPAKPQKGFAPDFHISHELSSADVLADIVYSIPTPDGKIIGKSFDFKENSVELRGEAWCELLRIAGKVQSAPDYRNSVSFETLSDTIFEWIKDAYKGTTNQKPLDYLSDKCEPKIQEFEAWVPIAETYVEGELEFGNVIFKQVTGSMIDSWERDCVTHFPDRTGWTEHFDRWRRNIQGLAAATMQVRAEPQRAYEIIVREAEWAIALLRCLSFFNGFSYLTSYSAPFGQAQVPSFWRFLTQADMLVNHSEGADDMSLREYQLTKNHIMDLKGLGLDHLDSLLKKTKRTGFENDLFSALLLYSRSSLQHTVADKLTYILAPLEFLLLDGSIDPESLGERLALLNAQDLSTRKSVVQNTKTVYQMRARLIRGEVNSDDLDQIQQFMATAWTFFINVIPNASKFKDRQEFIRQVENWKLSGGLKGAI